VNPVSSRRELLRQAVGASVVAAGLPALLAACGGDDGDADPTTTGAAATTGAPATTGASATTAAAPTTVAATVPDRGTLDFRLSYTPGVGFSGTYLAIKSGAYERAGFSNVNLIPGGPSATPSPVDVAIGKAFVGIASTPDQVAAARLNGGANVKIIGGLYQKNPYCVTSLAANPIKTAQDMVGKTIGVQAVNETVWNAFLAAAGIDPSSVSTVPVQFDPTPLTTGDVDGWFSFVINEPITLAAKGFDVETMLLADNGYPLVAQVYLATDEAIAGRRDDLVAVLGAEIEGWIESLTNPTAGPELVIAEYAKDLGLDLAVQTSVSETQNGLILTAETKASGLMTMTPELVAGNLATLALSGLTITAEDLFDLSLLDEVYAAKPELISALESLSAG
jgi:ABC-type nitrate/sulfonate/bicarbonate transport system substrate-binding protein